MQPAAPGWGCQCQFSPPLADLLLLGPALPAAGWFSEKKNPRVEVSPPQNPRCSSQSPQNQGTPQARQGKHLKGLGLGQEGNLPRSPCPMGTPGEPHRPHTPPDHHPVWLLLPRFGQEQLSPPPALLAGGRSACRDRKEMFAARGFISYAFTVTTRQGRGSGRSSRPSLQSFGARIRIPALSASVSSPLRPRTDTNTWRTSGPCRQTWPSGPRVLPPCHTKNKSWAAGLKTPG